jgi:hypothetical protein
MAQTTRNTDWPTYPLKPHQVAASAPTPDRSTTPAERMTREWRDDLTNPGPLQKPFLTRTVHDASMFDYRMLRNYTRSSFRLDVGRPPCDTTSARDAASTILNDLREKGLIATGGACRGLLGYF